MSTPLQAQPMTSAANPRLEAAQVEYYARYFGDPIARLFWYESELHLGILPAHTDQFRSFRTSPLFEELVSDELLMGLNESPLSVEGMDAIYRLERTPRITYWHEWSPKMWQAAALRLIELLRRLAEANLTLRNPHPWNLLFDGRAFRYINPGSVVAFDVAIFALAYEKIASFFVRPLLLAKHGFGHMARLLTEDVREGAHCEEVRHLQNDWSEWTGNEYLDVLPFLDKVSSEIGSMNLSLQGSHWIDYFVKDCKFESGTSWIRKQELLQRVLNDRNIRSVLDLGANIGHYARIAAEMGREVVAADFDPALVDELYLGTRTIGLPLYPVVLDFTHPASGAGVSGQWFPEATDRLSSDLVLCFALTHHFVFGKYRLDFEQIARGIHSFSNKCALVEYVERGKFLPEEWRPDADGWYSVEHLAVALRRHFHTVEVLPPALDGRRLLICESSGRLA